MPDTQNLAVTLTAGVSYVTGTVNGVVTTWTNTHDYVWETEAARSSNDIYRVELETVTTGGAVTNFSLVLYLGLQLITDREYDDVSRVEALAELIKTRQATNAEWAEYLNAPKGAYTAADLNRVGQAINYVAGILTENGYPYNPNMKTDWSDSDDFRTPTNLNPYLQGVAGLRAILPVPADTPLMPTNISRWTEANDFERIIEVVFLIMQAMIAAYDMREANTLYMQAGGLFNV